MVKAHSDTRSGRTNDREKLAIERVRRAGVKATESAILAWVRSVGPEAILSATLKDTRAIANAF